MIKPLNDNILIEEIFEEEKRTSGIILVKKEETDIKKGKIMQVGVLTPTLKKGDIVYYNRFSAIPICHNEKQYFIVNTYDILAVEE